jgi:hypothetical protein
MQQGVPLVDADWNEMNDIIRHEIYNGLKQVWPNGDYISGDSLRVSYDESNHLIKVEPGSAIIKGMPVHLRETAYKSQDLSNLYSYLVYLDIWEQEVDSDADPDLENSLIGIETCVRLKRQIEVKVIQGSTWRMRPDLPREPKGHVYVQLAFLRRNIIVDVEHGSPPQPILELEDVRPGIQEISVFPTFIAVEDVEDETSPYFPYNWHLAEQSLRILERRRGEINLLRTPFKYVAANSPGHRTYGIIPLNLPQNARMLELKIEAYTEVNIVFGIFRFRRIDRQDPDNDQRTPHGEPLLQQFFHVDPDAVYPFNLFKIIKGSYPLEQGQQCIVDNENYLYGLFADTLEPTPYVAEINSFSIICRSENENSGR